MRRARTEALLDLHRATNIEKLHRAYQKAWTAYERALRKLDDERLSERSKTRILREVARFQKIEREALRELIAAGGYL